LITAGVSEQEDAQRGFHVCFSSDVAPCQDDKNYGGSISLEKAMAKDGDVILAYEVRLLFQ
jgi:sulfite oxidase